MNFILMQFGYPPVIIKTEDKESYYAVLRLADADQLEPFIEYTPQNLVRSLEIMIRGAKGDDIEEPDDFDKELALLEGRIRTSDDNLKSKTDEAMKYLAKAVVIPFIRDFILVCSKFDRFYLKTEIVVLSSGQVFFQGSKEEVLQQLDTLIDDVLTVPSLRVFYKNEEFVNPDLGSFDCRFNLDFTFKELSYSVDLRGDSLAFSTHLERSYDETISIDEMQEVLKKLAKFHQAFIEEKASVIN